MEACRQIEAKTDHKEKGEISKVLIEVIVCIRMGYQGLESDCKGEIVCKCCLQEVNKNDDNPPVVHYSISDKTMCYSYHMH